MLDITDADLFILLIKYLMKKWCDVAKIILPYPHPTPIPKFCRLLKNHLDS